MRMPMHVSSADAISFPSTFTTFLCTEGGNSMSAASFLPACPRFLRALSIHSNKSTLAPICTFPSFGKAPSAWNQSKYISPSLYHHVFTRSRSSAELNQTGSPFNGRNTFTRRSVVVCQDRKSTRLNSSHLVISYAVFCLKKKKHNPKTHLHI